MKKLNLLFSVIIISCFFLSCRTELRKKSEQIKEYIPTDQKLFNEIITMDKIFFDAYNTCDIKKQASIYSDKIEFFHDKAGLMTSKKDILDATEKNICGKVTRELIKGTSEVYRILNYGAIQIGFHKFHNNQEPNTISNPSKFIMVWNNDNGEWKITKVISLH